MDSSIFMPSTVDLELLVSMSIDVLCFFGSDLKMQWFSPSAASLFGRNLIDLVGCDLADLVHPDDYPELKLSAERLFAGTNDGYTTLVRIKRPDSATIYVETNARVVPDGEGSRAVLVIRDITDRKLAADKLTALAATDGLTGLPNRRALDERLEREWKRHARSGGCLSLLMIDVDHFKRYNDSYGHLSGDDCLRTVAAVLAAALDRPADFAARYGGEEFAVVAPETDGAGAARVAKRICLSVATLRLPHIDHPEAIVTVSIGIATLRIRTYGIPNSLETLKSLADEALYKAKHSGRNRVCSIIAPEEAAP
jgi:diguanylate cyclase (GGDEF)-like protein/PAS domain S-box-containing protein